MRLRIDNFAKIKHADILIDGITVIAGENNTGKSTIGKVIYSVFNSLHDLNDKIEDRRKEEMMHICNHYFRNSIAHSSNETFKHTINNGYTRMLSAKFAEALVEKLNELDDYSLTGSAYKELIYEVLNQYGMKMGDEQVDEYIEDTFDKILLRKQNDNYKIALEIIQRFFLQIFNSQMQCLKNTETEASISLTIKDKDTLIQFNKNECINWHAEYDILHEAFFLDDPFVLDELSAYYLTNSIRGQLKKRLFDVENNIMDGLFDAVSAKEDLKEIYDILNKVAKGDILIKNGKWGLNAEQFEEPVNFENLSAGLKSFVLIKVLLEKGILKKEDVLILDEPEIHLHPQWQLFYAEIIVLLQKKFSLNIVVTTHSSHFLEAIEYYSKMHELEHKCNYYLSGMKEGLAFFQDVTSSLDKIYTQMVTPNMLLDKLKYEMVNTDD